MTFAGCPTYPIFTTRFGRCADPSFQRVSKHEIIAKGPLAHSIECSPMYLKVQGSKAVFAYSTYISNMIRFQYTL